MRVHHIGCGTPCPSGDRLIDGITRGVGQADLVCLGRIRCRPAQWGETGTWRTDAVAGESWMDMPAVRTLDGLPPEVLPIPLAGHTAGHCGVAVETGEGWLLRPRPRRTGTHRRRQLPCRRSRSMNWFSSMIGRYASCVTGFSERSRLR